MDQEQARAMLITLCKELLATQPGTTHYTFDQISDLLVKRFCAEHLAGFVAAWSDAPCVCGQALCPAGLKRAVQRCFYGARSERQNAPTSREVH